MAGMAAVGTVALMFVRQCGAESAATAKAAAPSAGFVWRAQRFSVMKGLGVFDRDGEKLGRIDDVVADVGSGRVLCARVAPARVYGDFHVLIPAECFAASEVTGAVLGCAQTNLLGAPRLGNAVTNSDAIAKAVTEAYAYFGQGCPDVTNTSAAVVRCSQLTSAPIQDRAGHDFGKVSDLMVDLAGGRLFFVVGFLDGPSGGLYAAPPTALNWDCAKGRLVLGNVEPKAVYASEGREFIWSEMANPAWAGETYRRYGREAEFGWAGVASGPVMAEGQAESENLFAPVMDSDVTVRMVKPVMRSDGEMTRDLLAAVMRERLDGENLKIMANGGRMSLSGRVKDAETKARLAALAEGIAGRGAVDNELEVEQ